ncbi:MAG: ABC transporter ATP-binding protein [Sandaracinaceae bacterium]
MIVVDHVTKYYGSTPAVQDLDFTIEDGECVGFLGLNGAGKSTTLRLLSCLLLPTSGRITIRGLDVESDPHEIRKQIGYLPDTPPLYPEMTVRGFLEFAGRLRRMSGKAMRDRLPELVETAGLEEVLEQPIGTLSHGYRQRVGSAQAIVHRPALLILDEPIQGLDPVQIVEMRELVRSLRGEHTILLSTHILREIEQTCDRILMLDRGHIAAQGSEEELVERFGGGGALRLEVRGTQEAVRQALSAVLPERGAPYRTADGGSELGVTYQSLGADLWQVELETAEDVREMVAAAVVGAGLGLLTLERTAPPLERIFVELSRGPAAAGGAAGAAPAGQEAPR